MEININCSEEQYNSLSLEDLICLIVALSLGTEKEE